MGIDIDTLIASVRALPQDERNELACRLFHLYHGDDNKLFELLGLGEHFEDRKYGKFEPLFESKYFIYAIMRHVSQSAVDDYIEQHTREQCSY